jgi:hypothetical protein
MLLERRLVAAGRFKKDQQEKIIDLIWAWVKGPDIESLDKGQDELFKALHKKEQMYISEYYQEKEPQFCRTYTRHLPNLGVHSTQRNESYHAVVKTRLHKHLPISKAVHTIVDQTADLGHKYDAEINRNRKSLPRLLDPTAFATVGDKLTHYTLGIALREWSSTNVGCDGGHE